MNKSLLIGIFFGLSYISKADIYITKYTNCDITVNIKAHCTAASSVCVDDVIASMDYRQYATVADVYTPDPGWLSSFMGSGAGRVLDPVKFHVAGSVGSGHQVGPTAACSHWLFWLSGGNYCGSGYTAQWSVIGTDIFEDFI